MELTSADMKFLLQDNVWFDVARNSTSYVSRSVVLNWIISFVKPDEVSCLKQRRKTSALHSELLRSRMTLNGRTVKQLLCLMAAAIKKNEERREKTHNRIKTRDALFHLQTGLSFSSYIFIYPLLCEAGNELIQTINFLFFLFFFWLITSSTFIVITPFFASFRVWFPGNRITKCLMNVPQELLFF